MAPKKGFTNNPKGRPKGTPNKATAELKEWVAGLINKNRIQLEKDLKKLDPKDRFAILEKLMAYVIPKQQSISVEAQIAIEYDLLEKLLTNAPDEAIEEIEKRINKLQNGK